MTNETETTDDPKEAEPEELRRGRLMLEETSRSRSAIPWSKAFASSDEKAQILIQAEEGFEPQEGESFAEVAMPEIEAMAQL